MPTTFRTLLLCKIVNRRLEIESSCLYAGKKWLLRSTEIIAMCISWWLNASVFNGIIETLRNANADTILSALATKLEEFIVIFTVFAFHVPAFGLVPSNFLTGADMRFFRRAPAGCSIFPLRAPIFGVQIRICLVRTNLLISWWCPFAKNPCSLFERTRTRFVFLTKADALVFLVIGYECIFSIGNYWSDINISWS